MTEIVYPVNLRFPMERANSIQIVQTCHALARGGAGVTLLVRGGTDPTSEAASLAFYGLAPHRRLHIRRLPVLPASAPPRLRNRLFLLALGLECAVRAAAGRADAFFVRDDGVARMLIGPRRVLRVPVIFEMHHLAHLFLKMRHEMYSNSAPVPAAQIARHARIDRRLYEQADAIVCVTRSLADLLAGTFGPRPKVHVVRSGVTIPPEPIRREPGKGIIYAGQLYPWKGVDVLVRAMARLPDATLEIIGGLPYEPDAARLQALAGSIGLAERVRFYPFVPPGELPARLSRAAVAAVPLPDNLYNRVFTSPLKIFEAMAVGIPIVASDLPAIREVIRDGENGILVPPGDPEALAAGLDRVLGDPALGESIARQARKDVEAYAWDRHAEEIRAIVEGLQ